jgi:hypothetical protein
MTSLRSSVRQRLEAEEAESNSVEQSPETKNPVEEAAQAAIQDKLDEQPDPVVKPKPMQAEKDDDDDEYADEVNQLELRLADAAAQVAGHKFGSRGYVDAVASRLRQEDAPRRSGERGPSVTAPVSRSTPSWSSGRSTPSKTELTGEEIAFARSVGVDPEEYRRNKAKMHQMKASGVIQE